MRSSVRKWTSGGSKIEPRSGASGRLLGARSAPGGRPDRSWVALGAALARLGAVLGFPGGSPEATEEPPGRHSGKCFEEAPGGLLWEVFFVGTPYTAPTISLCCAIGPTTPDPIGGMQPPRQGAWGAGRALAAEPCRGYSRHEVRYSALRGGRNHSNCHKKPTHPKNSSNGIRRPVLDYF